MDVVQESHDVTLQLRRRVLHPLPNGVHDVAHRSLAVEQLPDQEPDGVDAVVLGGLEMEQDATLGCRELPRDHLRALPDSGLWFDRRRRQEGSVEAEGPAPSFAPCGKTERDDSQGQCEDGAGDEHSGCVRDG